jgi:hypothetical protein
MPEIVWLGVKIGEWPIQAFGSEDQAVRWVSASEKDGVQRDRRIWSVAVPADTVAYTAEIVPASYKMKQVHP